MYPVTYRLTLYNTKRFDEFLTYDFAELPVSGDTIEVCEGYLFEVRSRSFKPRNGKIISVRLHGEMLNGDEKEQHSWEKLKSKILDQREGIRRNREGMVEHREFTGFPDKLE
ncbi:hypothetical protein [Mucilaginibacter ginsenosidivorax]|uniref:Uncharacterized protein n=1 Tax=Mucilaginibacter ginsenosidivorax TaxID=862126 RepID=A0A5B8W8C7_9SPHI|nr:hypothetical protein [Mucilaginibacter ginsenosidivorax]QEC79707.1 hypothetical protein FSB76_28525 [Mucilaginibacter ginsenosidivorax]